MPVTSVAKPPLGGIVRVQKVVVITGATSGVGRATARVFAERGCGIGVLARGEDGLKATAADIEELGGRALAIPTDIADAEQVERASAQIEAELGEIDVWINNAMTSVFAPFWQITAEEYERVTDVTYHGVVNGTRVALARMMPRDRGTIVQVGSALAYRGIPLQSAYCGAKHAIQGFTESVRCELLHDRSGVHIYQPEVAARAIEWAADHPYRHESWVGATTAATILANDAAPGLLDRYLALTGVKAQQTDEQEDPRRPNNLFGPVPGDHGAHGDFDAHAHAHSPEVVLSTKKRLFGLTALGAAVGLALRRRATR
ncbi:MAG: SDR family oxidoreductase [Actinobacteria bacterium]|nr:MAG: SDR family oxidoreductase [Actinomycetota bacterium]